jgi:hypothetical protein
MRMCVSGAAAHLKTGGVLLVVAKTEETFQKIIWHTPAKGLDKGRDRWSL